MSSAKTRRVSAGPGHGGPLLNPFKQKCDLTEFGSMHFVREMSERDEVRERSLERISSEALVQKFIDSHSIVLHFSRWISPEILQFEWRPNIS
jgi:hypothetical protein